MRPSKALKEPLKSCLPILLFIGLGLLLGCLCVDAYLKGEIHLRGGPVRRMESPISFWIAIGFNAFMSTLALSMGGFLIHIFRKEWKLTYRVTFRFPLLNSVASDRSKAMAPIKPAAEDLAARQPVWEALSDMFLDTDTSLLRKWRVAQLAQSPYSIEQLEAILIEEVYPVCKYNLSLAAGEWAGFDSEWLRDAILRRLRSRFQLSRILKNLVRFAVFLPSEWQATKQAVVASRGGIAKNAA